MAYVVWLEHLFELGVDKLGLEGKHPLARNLVLLADQILHSFNLYRFFGCSFDSGKQNSLGQGAQNGVELVSLLLHVYLVLDNVFVGNRDVVEDVHIDCEEDQKVRSHLFQLERNVIVLVERC